MSIKKIKNLGLILCCILLCVCVVGMFTITLKTYADDDVTPITLSELTTFTTKDGASIRTETPTGIRFATSIAQAEYDGLVKQYGEENLEFGMAIARVGSLEQLKAADTAKTLKPMSYWMAGAYPGSGAQSYKYTFAIVSINEENYNRQYTTIGYVKVGQDIVYAKTNGQEAACTRTPLQVATTILATMPEDDNSYANQIVDSVMATSPTFAVQDTSAPWGAETELVATVGGNAVTPVYTIADPTVAKAEGGKVIGLKKGSTEVTATLEGVNGTYTATATVTFSEKAITPTLNADGMLNLETAGEQTTISVYDKTGAQLVIETTTTAQTFDIRDYIISYMEDNDITTNNAYTVKVASANYAGTYTTETFMPISTAAQFYAIEPNYWAGFSAYKKLGNYYYLTSDIDISNYASKNSAHGISMWACVEFSLDGRGYTISNTYTHTSGNYGGIAIYGGDTGPNDGVDFWSWKNVHYQANVTVNEGADATGILISNISSINFYNCYFEANVVNNGNDDTGLLGAKNDGKFVNCVFELNNSSKDAKDLVLLRKWDFNASVPLYDCVVINNDDATEVITHHSSHVDAVAHTVYRYTSLVDFIAGNNGVLRNDDDTAQNGAVANGTKAYANWSDAWEVTETDVKLLGQTVRTTLKTEVTPVMNAGMLTLNTKGEETAIKLYAANDAEFANVLSEDVTSAETYDVRDFIISYMEDSAKPNGEYSYVVTVESEGYEGTYTSEVFVPITKASEFVAFFTNDVAASKLNKDKYCFLTADMDISEYANRNVGAYAQTCLGVFTHINLDGRGHTITNTYEHTYENSNYAGLSGYMGYQLSGMEIRNLHYKANIALNSSKEAYGIFAYDVAGYTFYNCYIEANVMNNSSKAVSVMNLHGSYMYDCIIEINKASVSKNDVVVFGEGEAVAAQVYNCAIINSSSPNAITYKNGGKNVGINNCSTYGSFADYVADTTRYANWANNWIDNSSVQKQTATPTYANDVLTLGTNGEFTTVKLYASDDTEYQTVLATATAIKNINLYEFIVSYMEKNVKTYGEYTYTVVVESESYQGTYAHQEIFAPIANEELGACYGTRLCYVMSLYTADNREI